MLAGMILFTAGGVVALLYAVALFSARLLSDPLRRWIPRFTT